MIYPDANITSAYISVAGGFVTTVFTIIFGPVIAKRFSLSKRIRRGLNEYDKTLLQMQRSIDKRDRTIQYLNSKIHREDSKLQRLREINDKLQSEMDHERDIVDRLKRRIT